MYSEKNSCENFEPRKDVIEKVRSRQLSIFCNKDSFESIQINLKEPSLDVSHSETGQNDNTGHLATSQLLA